MGNENIPIRKITIGKRYRDKDGAYITEIIIIPGREPTWNELLDEFHQILEKGKIENGHK